MPSHSTPRMLAERLLEVWTTTIMASQITSRLDLSLYGKSTLRDERRRALPSVLNLSGRSSRCWAASRSARLRAALTLRTLSAAAAGPAPVASSASVATATIGAATLLVHVLVMNVASVPAMGGTRHPNGLTQPGRNTAAAAGFVLQPQAT